MHLLCESNETIATMPTQRIQISLASDSTGILNCVGFRSFPCLGKANAPYVRDATITGIVGVDKFPVRRSIFCDCDLNWVLIMDGTQGFWIHEGVIDRPTSAGCINLTASDAEAVYNWVAGRTRITIDAPW